nr:disulfide bond formation protein B [uncultured Chryseobacterium sp.]
MNNQNIAYINISGILIVSAILTGVYYFQIVLNKSPCPVCLLQQMCFFGFMFGLFLNLRFGFKRIHYGLSILSGLLGAFISFWQILIHTSQNPTDPSNEILVLGTHLYNWALIAFLSGIAAVVFLLLLPKQFEKTEDHRLNPVFDFLASLAFGLCFLLAITNELTTFLEC